MGAKKIKILDDCCKLERGVRDTVVQVSFKFAESQDIDKINFQPATFLPLQFHELCI